MLEAHFRRDLPWVLKRNSAYVIYSGENTVDVDVLHLKLYRCDSTIKGEQSF